MGLFTLVSDLAYVRILLWDPWPKIFSPSLYPLTQEERRGERPLRQVRTGNWGIPKPNLIFPIFIRIPSKLSQALMQLNLNNLSRNIEKSPTLWCWCRKTPWFSSSGLCWSPRSVIASSAASQSLTLKIFALPPFSEVQSGLRFSG